MGPEAEGSIFEAVAMGLLVYAPSHGYGAVGFEYVRLSDVFEIYDPANQTAA